MTDNREPARIGVTVQLTEEQTRALAAGQAVDIVVRLVPDGSATCSGSPAGMGAAAMELSSDDGTSYAHQESMWESSPTAGELLPGAVSRRAVVSLDSTLPEAETLFR